MATKEMERLKQILPKISARLADRKEHLIRKMKELGIFKDNVDIFQTLAESNNFEILEYLKEILRIEGLETIVRDIEGKTDQAGDATKNSTSSADNGTDFVCDDLESKSNPISRELQEMRQEMMKGFQAMSDKIEEARAEAREHNEEAKKREIKLLELISKLEKDKDEMKDEMKKELNHNSPAGIDKAGLETLQRKFHDLETKHNQLLNKMKKMGTTEKALIERNKQLEKEIAQVRLQLISMQVTKSEKGKMYAKLAKTDKK